MKNKLFSHEGLRNLLLRQNVAIAYLFGSQARGNPGPLSDIDIAFLFNEKVSPKEYFEKNLLLAHELRNSLQTDQLDFVNLAETDDPLLRYRAVFGGKLIFAADEKIRFALEDSVMKAYEDTRYLRAVQGKYLYKQIQSGEFGKRALL